MVYFITTITVMVAVILPFYLFHKRRIELNFEKALKELESDPNSYNADEAIKTFEKSFKRKATWEEKYIIFYSFNKGVMEGIRTEASQTTGKLLKMLKQQIKTSKGD